MTLTASSAAWLASPRSATPGGCPATRTTWSGLRPPTDLASYSALRNEELATVPR